MLAFCLLMYGPQHVTGQAGLQWHLHQACCGDEQRHTAHASVGRAQGSSLVTPVHCHMSRR
jgi:hypothetical protein